MSYVDQPPKWRVGEFWSSADPDRKVLVIAEGKEIVSYPKRVDFIRWLEQSYSVANADTGTLVCPFCGGSHISDGESMTQGVINGKVVTTVQSMCEDCGACGPVAYLDIDEVDYGDVKAIAAWNRREVQP